MMIPLFSAHMPNNFGRHATHPLTKTSPNFHIWSRGHWPKWSSDGEFSSESDSAGWVWHSNRFPMTTENYAKTTPNCFVTTYVDLKPLASWCRGNLIHKRLSLLTQQVNILWNHSLTSICTEMQTGLHITCILIFV